MNSNQTLPEKIRLSVGSAMVLGLLKGVLDAPPTTIYMLTHREEKCLANCSFCPQARTSTSRADMLSRVTWPAFPTTVVIQKISSLADESKLKRACIQALNYSTVFQDIVNIAKEIHSKCKVPISISCQPLNTVQLKELAKVGVDRVSIALDAATEQLFDKVKGVQTQSLYTWNKQRKALEDAVEIFGRDRVYTHLIIGLGETEKDASEIIQWCTDSGIYPSLFAFTPIQGTAMENEAQPPIEAYRRVQLARHLILNEIARSEDMRFDAEGRIVSFGIPKPQMLEIVEEGTPFRTSGCPECNRPYYNERPGGPLYNLPRRLQRSEIDEIKRQLLEG